MASIIRWGVRAAVLIALIVGGHEIIDRVNDWLNISVMPHTEDMLHRSIVIGTAIYVALMATPFIPGAEIGLTLLTVLGGAIAPLVYLATTVSLMIAFTLGRLLPPTILQRGLAALGLRRAAVFVGEAATMRYDDVCALLAPKSAPRVVRFLLRFRYVALALALNAPGNIVLGGGGGIALVAGLSRVFSPLPFLLTVLVAVLPVPLFFFLGQA